MGIWIRSQNERKDAERMLLREVFQGSGQKKPEEGGVGMDYKDAIRQFECYQKSGWSKSEVPNSACLVLALDALNRCRQLEAESAAMLERVQRLESIAEAAQEVLQKEPTIICPRCDGSAGVERCVCEPWELLRQTVVEFKRVEGGK